MTLSKNNLTLEGQMEQNSSYTIRPWLIISLIVVVLAAAGFFGWNYLYNNKPVVAPAVTPTVSTKVTKSITPSITPTATSSISTADWKTYTNTNYGYSIKYPSNYYVAYYDDTAKTYKFATSGVTQVVIYSPNDGGAPGQEMAGPMDNINLLIDRVDNPKNLSLEAFATQAEEKDARDNQLVYQHKTIKIDGQDGIISTPTPASIEACGGLGCADVTVYLQKNNHFFTFTGNLNDGSQTLGSDAETIINNIILSTFKFAK